VLLLALPLMIYLGSELGDDDYILPVSITGLLVVGLLVALLFRGMRLECLVLAFLLFGYIVGNRGFAQLSVTPPFFVGEVGMSIIILVLVIRFLLSREFLIPEHPLTWLIGTYLIFAFVRFGFDVKVYALDAARDLAIVYYALFYFIAFQLGRRERELKFLDGTLKWSFVFLAIIAPISVLEPSWLELLQVRGAPLLAQKGDLTATFSAVAVFALLLRPEMLPPTLLRRGIIAVLLACIALLLSRSTMVAMMCAFVLAWVTGIRLFRFYAPLLALLGVITLLALSLMPEGTTTAEVQDQALSMVDVSGSYSYQTELGNQKSGDNSFRRALWLSFFNQTVRDNQWLLGKGFGYDFLPQFEEEYQGGHWEALRSAHNYYVTVFGRMGAVGLGLMLAITAVMARGGLQAAAALRRGEITDARVAVYWCGAWIILVSGTFGVVMEGPMGAIPFWTLTGLALGCDPRIKSRSRGSMTEEHAPVDFDWTQVGAATATLNR
jgi:hypothetical protein